MKSKTLISLLFGCLLFVNGCTQNLTSTPQSGNNTNEATSYPVKTFPTRAPLILQTTTLTPKTKSANAYTIDSYTKEALHIYLHRTACFGSCPIYSLDIYGDGQVIFNGEDHVKMTGSHTSTLSKEKLQELLSVFQEADYFSLKNQYTEHNTTDMPYCQTSLQLNGTSKSVNHYYGDDSAPATLTKLEDKIGEIVNSNQWIK